MKRWDESKDAAANASERLPKMAAAYFKAGRALLAGNAPAAELHRFRLKTKRFRYTLELFRNCYGPTLDARCLAGLQDVQRRLGEVNDCAIAAGLAAKSQACDSEERAVFARFLEERLAQRVAEFRRYWTEEFDAPGNAEKWERYLGRSKPPSVARPH